MGSVEFISGVPAGAMADMLVRRIGPNATKRENGSSDSDYTSGVVDWVAARFKRYFQGLTLRCITETVSLSRINGFRLNRFVRLA
jgi:hypothetical protein